MIKKIGILLLIATGANAQDKGKFESYSNPFYGTIISESNKYEKEEKETTKSFKMNFDGKMSYGDYLCLDNILNSQIVRSSAHDEMLFIIQHQTSELWLKLALHELDGARLAIKSDNLQKSFKMLSRVTRIFEQLNNAWDVLRTMTPSEYTEFRDKLGQSSGFQSYQYRELEFLLSLIHI